MTLTLVATLGPNLDEASSDLARALTDLGIDCRFEPTTAPDRALQAIKAGKVDIMWMCGLLTLDLGLGDRTACAPIFPGETAPVYRSVLVAESRNATLDPFHPSLRWAMNEPVSWSGCRVVFEEFATRGLTGPADVVWTGSHLDSIEAVASGRADLAAIDQTVWRWARPDGLAVVGTTRSWPSPPISIGRRYDDDIARLRAALSSVGNRLRNVGSLVPVDGSHLDAIETAQSSVRTAHSSGKNVKSSAPRR